MKACKNYGAKIFLYRRLSGTSVLRDFVELPSQIMEQWATEPVVLEMYAKHYLTGEVLPGELIEKIKETSRFNLGFETVEYLAACLLDMDWSTISERSDFDVDVFEADSLRGIGLIPEISSRYQSTNFLHIFYYGYSSGYYSYVWAEVLDADAYELFKEKRIFDKETAKSFKDNILSKGGTAHPMDLYEAFRGRKPTTDALLKRKGFK